MSKLKDRYKGFSSYAPQSIEVAGGYVGIAESRERGQWQHGARLVVGQYPMQVSSKISAWRFSDAICL